MTNVTKSTRIGKGLALTLGAVLLISMSGLALAGADAARDSILPLVHGEDVARERALSRGEASVALAVHVAAMDDDGNRSWAAGALVTVSRIACEGEPERDPASPGALPSNCEHHPVAREETVDRGVAVFELRPGAYHVLVEHADDAGSVTLRIHRDTRVGAFFDEDGNAHFLVNSRAHLRDHGERSPLLVRVMRETPRGIEPVEGAHAVVYEPARDREGNASADALQRKATNERGAAIFGLAPGSYGVGFTWEGHAARTHVTLEAGAAVGFLIDRDGDVHVRTADRDEWRDHFEEDHREREGYALGVVVTAEGEDDHPRPVPGALVKVYEVPEEGRWQDTEPVARQTTNDDGFARLHLPGGSYVVTASYEHMEGVEDVRLDDDQALRVHIS